MADQVNSLRGLVVKLAKEIDYKNHLLLQKEGLSLEKFATLSCLVEEKDRLLGERSEVIGALMAQKHRLHEAYVEGMQKFEETKLELNKVKHDLEAEKQKLYQNTRALVEHQADNEKRLGIVTASYPSTSGSLKSPELNLAVQAKCKDSDNERNKEQRSWIIQEVKLERHYPSVHNEELKTQNDILKKELDRKEKTLLEIERHYQDLISKELSSNEELQAARRKAIDCFLTMDGTGTRIRIKNMGKIDRQTFRKACSKNIRGQLREGNFNKFYLSWQESVNDPSWNPFKKNIIDGKLSEVIDENDKKLGKLKKEWGEEAYKAVVDALFELNEYNPDMRHTTPELWNFEEGRKAYLKEAIKYIMEYWGFLKDKDNEQSGAIIELMTEKDRLLKQLADANILIGEKDKLINEKYAAIGKLMAQDVKKDKLVGKLSTTISTLMAEKRILLDKSDADKREMQYMKQIEKLNNKLQCEEVVLQEQNKELREIRGCSDSGNGNMKIKMESIDYNFVCMTDQLEPVAKKLKDSNSPNFPMQMRKIDLNQTIER